MSARHTHRWLAWLLPLLLLRAFVPVGFMLSWSHEGLQLVMCSGSGPMAKLNGSVAIAGQHEHRGDAHATGGHQGHDHARAESSTMCAFAAAGTAAALPSFHASVAFVATVSLEARGPQDLDLPVATVLIDRIRGPPLA